MEKSTDKPGGRSGDTEEVYLFQMGLENSWRIDEAARTGDGSRLLPTHQNPCAGPQAGHTHLSGKLCSEMGQLWAGSSNPYKAWQLPSLAAGSQRHLSDPGYVRELDRGRPAQASPAEQSKPRQAGSWLGRAGQW